MLQHDLPSLFSGKLCALLLRKYTKGRDWYDFIWYRTRKTPVNGKHLAAGYRQATEVQVEANPAWLAERLKHRIAGLDIEIVKRDLRPFLEDVAEL
ncbi:MAG: nucleotidyl transferase AbiEii/AbiGii toxin family protein, partial [Candidatus Aenigmarchaeota archaeon]|nr:nucleotidyl transferase AbiEii/AbiGii toxin family protein [Candidatus Aenigmarchaeota archaeon]